MTKAESLRSVLLAITRPTIDLLVRTIALQSRVQWTVAVAAVVTPLVPHRSTSQLLLSCKHSTLATRATSSLGSRNGCRVWRCRGTTLGQLFLPGMEGKLIKETPLNCSLTKYRFEETQSHRRIHTHVDPNAFRSTSYSRRRCLDHHKR